MTKHQILIPISSRSSFFPESEFYFPKPLVNVAGRPMIEQVIRHLRGQLGDCDFTFIVNQEHGKDFSITRILKLAAGEGTRVIERTGKTAGALCSCLLAVDTLDRKRSVIIANSDQIIDDNLADIINSFEISGSDAGVVTFDAVHPRWSYVILDEKYKAIQAVEKRVVSRHAIGGVYWFKTVDSFLNAAQSAILKGAQVGGQFYLSASLNELILAGGEVSIAQIDGKKYHNFYAPSQIKDFEHTALVDAMRRRDSEMRKINVVIPAAGEGSRFSKAGWKRPKPFIDVMGRPMIDHVIKNVTPQNAVSTLLLRQEHMIENPEIASDLRATGATIISVNQLTEGTACTVLLARHSYDSNDAMMVANSDQIVDFDVNAFVADCFDRQLDGSILVFRDPNMDPKWSYVKLREDGTVEEVAEKKPISDLATVGIYLFTRGKDFVGACADMIALNDRVNGEFYTCPVYNYLIRNGGRIGVYEIPISAMHGIGTPDDLKLYLNARNAEPSKDRPSDSLCM